MPLAPDAPETTDVEKKTTETKTLDVVHIDAFRPAFDHNDPTKTKLHVAISYGYMEGDQFVSGKIDRHLITGANLLAALTGSVDANLNLYDNVKAALWQLLIDEGKVSGTVS